jgi:arabinogalactan oligomer/maltooligosaccharide transport system substrate-binding protein
MRRRQLGKGTTISVAAALLLMASACGGGDDGDTAAPTDAGTEPAAGGGGSLLIWTSDLEAPGVEAVGQAFSEEQGVTVEVEVIAEELQTQFVTASQAGNAPDLLTGAHDWIGNLVQNGTIDPIQMTEEQKAQFNPKTIEAFTYNGQLYAVPYAIENIVLFRNTDYAPEPPGTFEEMLATGQQCVANGQCEEIMALPVGETGDPYHMYPFYTSAGGYLFGENPDGGYNPDDLGLAEPSAAEAMAKIGANGETGTGAFKRSISGENSVALFTEGRTAYIVTGPWSLPAIVESGIPYAISPIPGFEGAGPARPFIGAYGLFVASGGQNKAIAQEFATNYWSTLDSQLALYEAGGRAPALTEAFDQVAPENPDVQAILDAGKDGDPMPAIPEMAAIWSPMGVAVAAVVGGEDPAAATEAAATAVQEAIG